MHPHLTSSEHSRASQAAQIAISLRKSGKLRSYTYSDLEASLSVHAQDNEAASELTDELMQEIHKRVGQMIALEQLAVSLDVSSASKETEEPLAA